MNCASAVCGLILAASFGIAASKPLDVPFIRQEKNGCGAASVAMVARYWAVRNPGPISVPSPHSIYERLLNAERGGVLLADMKGYLAEIGYKAFTFRGAWGDIEEHLSKGRPVIVGLRPSPRKDLHFVVLTGADDSHVWLNDPTRKRPNSMKKAGFEKQWALGERWLLLATP